MEYYVVLTDWKNVGMLVRVVDGQAFVFSYPDEWLTFNFEPYMQSGIEEADEEYREISETEALLMIQDHHFPDGKTWYDWGIEMGRK